MSSNDTWTTFCSALHDAECKYFTDQVLPTVTVENGEGSEDEDDDASTDSDEPSSHVLFAPLSDSARFGNISNLRALRLLFDVSAHATRGLPTA